MPEPLEVDQRPVTEDEIRDLVRKQASPYATAKVGSTGVTIWGIMNGVHKGALSSFMAGKRAPGTDLLDALGLEWRIVPKACKRGGKER